MTKKQIAIIGGGVIGGGWAARFLLNGWDVMIFDPAKDTKENIDAILHNARHSLPALYHCSLPEEGTLQFAESLSQAVQSADWIQESVPENLAIKHEILADIQQYARDDTIIASSTSGFKPSQLQENMKNPEQILVCHPFNPVYLLPLVEIVPSAQNNKTFCDKVMAILTNIGMKPLLVRQEIDAHIADRLLEAVWRESLWLVNDGIATTHEIDDAIIYGFGLRWAQMGLFETYRIAGGKTGMKHFIEQFGPALEWEWTKLMNVPELNEKLITQIAKQSDAQSGHYSIQQLERIRDDNLVGIMHALKKNNHAAGATIKQHETALMDSQQVNQKDSGKEYKDGLLITVQRQIPQNWVDFNGHMNEAYYLQVFSQASDQLLTIIGVDEDYIARGKSYFTVQTHIYHLDEVHIGDNIIITTQVILGASKKLHLLHRLYHHTGRLCATGEHFLLHVDLKTRKTCLPSEEIDHNLMQWEKKYTAIELPEQITLKTNF